MTGKNWTDFCFNKGLLFLVHLDSLVLRVENERTMSKAFTREDVDPPERSGRVRSTSGLPPGAANYITAGGAARLNEELGELRSSSTPNESRITELERILASVTVVNASDDSTDSVAFGAKVTLRNAAGELQTYRIVGVDELDLEGAGAVSWISPIGKTLLAAGLGDRVTLDQSGPARVEKIEYPKDDTLRS